MKKLTREALDDWARRHNQILIELIQAAEAEHGPEGHKPPEDPIGDFWFRTFVEPYEHCAMCGNSGMLDVMTRTPAGKPLRHQGACFCPNGRLIAKAQEKGVLWCAQETRPGVYCSLKSGHEGPHETREGNRLEFGSLGAGKTHSSFVPCDRYGHKPDHPRCEVTDRKSRLINHSLLEHCGECGQVVKHPNHTHQSERDGRTKFDDRPEYHQFRLAQDGELCHKCGKPEKGVDWYRGDWRVRHVPKGQEGHGFHSFVKPPEPSEPSPTIAAAIAYARSVMEEIKGYSVPVEDPREADLVEARVIGVNLPEPDDDALRSSVTPAKPSGAQKCGVEEVMTPAPSGAEIHPTFGDAVVAAAQSLGIAGIAAAQQRDNDGLGSLRPPSPSGAWKAREYPLVDLDFSGVVVERHPESRERTLHYGVEDGETGWVIAEAECGDWCKRFPHEVVLTIERVEAAK